MVDKGDNLPDVPVMTMTADGPESVYTGELLGHGTAVLFAVPGAFTPVCRDFHLPGYVLRAEDLKNKGVDTIACIAVNDPFVMGAWGEAAGVNTNLIHMLADPDAEFTKAMGLDLDTSQVGLGPIRSQRYSAILDNGRITKLHVEAQPTDHSLSAVDNILAQL